MSETKIAGSEPEVKQIMLAPGWRCFIADSMHDFDETEFEEVAVVGWALVDGKITLQIWDGGEVREAEDIDSPDGYSFVRIVPPTEKLGAYELVGLRLQCMRNAEFRRGKSNGAAGGAR